MATMAAAISNDVDDVDGDRQQCGPPPSSTGEPCIISYLGRRFCNNSRGGVTATATAKDGGGHCLQMRCQKQKLRHRDGHGHGGRVDKDNGGDGARDGSGDGERTSPQGWQDEWLLLLLVVIVAVVRERRRVSY